MICTIMFSAPFGYAQSGTLPPADSESLKNIFLSIKIYEDGKMFTAAKSSAVMSYNLAYEIASERLNTLKNAGKNAKVADERESLAWQILSEIYLSPYITPRQRERLTDLAADSLSNLGLIEDQYKTPLEGLDHFFALSILAQSRYSGAETEQDYLNIEKGIAKNREVPPEIIRIIENSTDRPFVSSTYFAAALRAVYDFAGAEEFYNSENRLRTRVLKEQENPYLWAELYRRLKNKLLTSYGNVENYSIKERYSYALCDESIYPLTKEILNNNFYNPPDAVFKVNSALCLLNAPDAADKQKSDAAAFIEKTYFTKDVETLDPEYGAAVVDSHQEPAPDGTFISDLNPKEASLFRQRMINILYQNTLKYGNRYLKGDYSEAVKRADGKPRLEEQIYSVGTTLAEIIGIDLAIAALTGGESLTVSLPRWGSRIILWSARSGTQTFRVIRAAGAVEGGTIVWAKAAEKSAETLLKMRQIPAAAVNSIKTGMETAVTNPAFAGITDVIKIPAEEPYYFSDIGKYVLPKLANGESRHGYDVFQLLYDKEMRALKSSIVREAASPNRIIQYENQRKMQEIGDVLRSFENGAFKNDAWLKKARVTYNQTQVDQVPILKPYLFPSKAAPTAGSRIYDAEKFTFSNKVNGDIPQALTGTYLQDYQSLASDKTVLYITDEYSYAKTATEILGKDFRSFEIARGQNDAIAKLMAGKYDLVLMDMNFNTNMGRVAGSAPFATLGDSGYDIAKAIRAAKLPRQPRIICAASWVPKPEDLFKGGFDGSLLIYDDTELLSAYTRPSLYKWLKANDDLFSAGPAAVNRIYEPSKFYFTGETSGHPPQVLTGASLEQYHRLASEKSVLFVTDGYVYAKTAENTIGKDFRVFDTAMGKEDALKKLMSRKYDLVLMDMNFENVSGSMGYTSFNRLDYSAYDIIQAMRSARLPSQPPVVLTSSATANPKDLFDGGFDGMIKMYYDTKSVNNFTRPNLYNWLKANSELFK